VNNRLNLATKPFTNRVLPWVLTSILLVFSLVAMLFIFAAVNTEKTRAKSIQADLDNLKHDELAIEKQVDDVNKALTPTQIKSLKAANDLVDRKRFSWTRLFADLEAELPSNVRVARIAVRQIHTQGGRTVADLDLTVFAKSSTAVTDMIANMEQRGVFYALLRNQNLQKAAKGEGGSEYELDVQYSRPSSAPSEAETTVATRDQSGGER